MTKNSESYNEKFFSQYKVVRNFFRKFNRDSIIMSCMDYLITPVTNPIDQIKKQHWNIFLLIKWIYSDSKHPNPNNKINPIAFDKLRKYMYDLSMYVKPLNEYENLDLFFRHLAYQQFIYQKGLNLNQIHRQFVFFSTLNNNHYIKSTFYKLTGIKLINFIELSLMLIGHFYVKKKDNVSEYYFNNLIELFGKNQIDSYWKTISLSFNELSTFFKRYTSNKLRNPSEYYEQTPFTNKPLIKFDSNYVCLDQHLLSLFVENYFYDLLKSYDAENFIPKFGPIFENYVKKTLIYSKLNFFHEEELKKILKPKNKIIDFVILEEKANIFIDAKAVEMSYNGKYSSNKIDIERCSNKSVIKAIHQAHDTNQSIWETKNSKIKFQDNNYALVITFQEMYLRNGLFYYKNISNKKVDKIISKYQQNLLIPLENIYFITLTDFDNLIEYVKNEKVTISSIIEYAKQNDFDDDPMNQKFHFSQHLHSLKAFESPSFLNEEHIKLQEKLKKFEQTGVK